MVSSLCVVCGLRRRAVCLDNSCLHVQSLQRGYAALPCPVLENKTVMQNMQASILHIVVIPAERRLIAVTNDTRKAAITIQMDAFQQSARKATYRLFKNG